METNPSHVAYITAKSESTIRYRGWAECLLQSLVVGGWITIIIQATNDEPQHGNQVILHTPSYALIRKSAVDFA